MFQKCRPFLTAGIFAIILLGAGQAKGQLDPAFGTGGISKLVAEGKQRALGNFLLPDGKMLVVLDNDATGVVNRKYEFKRLNADGSIDTAYGSGGTVQLPIPFLSSQLSRLFQIYNAARQPDGKIILVGYDNGDSLIVRLNEDGTLDSSFGGGSGLVRPNVEPAGTDQAFAVTVQPDGKILIGGTVFNASDPYFIRYNADGTLDPAFGSSGVIVHASLRTGPAIISVQSTGKFVCLIDQKLQRFNSDGSLDTGFPVTSTKYLSLLVLANDKILTTHYVMKTESFDRSNYDAVLSRYNADGTADSSFATAGSLVFDWSRYVDDWPATLKTFPDGRILVVGFGEIQPNRSKFKGLNGAAAIISASGTLQSRFLIPGFEGVTSGPEDGRNNVTIKPDGRIFFGGWDYYSAWDSDLKFVQITGVPNETYRFRNNRFDFKGGYDGLADLRIFRPSNSTWYPAGVFGIAGDIRVPADYIDDDFAAEVAVFRPSNGTWYISKNPNAGPTNIIGVQFGQSGDIPAPADFDGDAKADITVFRPSTGAWYIKNSTDDTLTALLWGMDGDRPVPGDYDGDGRDDIAVFRPSNGVWYIIKSSGGYSFNAFGMEGDIPVQDDYDGDGTTDIALWRPSTGVWYLINSATNTTSVMLWGLPDDLPIPADYDGDGKTDIAVWRSTGALWYLYPSTTNQMNAFTYGFSTDIPITARY